MKLFVFWFVFLTLTVISAKYHNILTLDENSVCQIKKSCLDCLRLPQCSWCSNENKCFSAKLVTEKGYCENSTIQHIDYGMSFDENAECSCATGEMERNCIPPGVAQEQECSGRGKCICGRCFCDANPDPEHPKKAVMGEYCEFDNFSCDGPKCSEGPYYINEQKSIDEEADTDADTIQPLEE